MPTAKNPHRHVRLDKEHKNQVIIEEDQAGRRLDNFLITRYPRVPGSRIYQMIRRGEVRVNGGRVRAAHRLQRHDLLRLPPIHMQRDATPLPGRQARRQLEGSVLYADESVQVINKPAGLAVHGGSRHMHGVIDILRAMSVGGEKLELVHRLDRLTSGCLLVASGSRALRSLRLAMRRGEVGKQYTVLLSGELPQESCEVDVPLLANRRLDSGEHRVQVRFTGKPAHTVFVRERGYRHATLCSALPLTGRTHQIRVHALHLGCPVVGDPRYGERSVNRRFRELGLRRMFLHASSLSFVSPATGERLHVEAPLPDVLQAILDRLA